MKEEKEVWKPVRNYEGLYEVSNMGRVKGLERTVWCGLNGGCYRAIPERILKARTMANGYLRVSLYKDGKGKGYYVHRLVGQEFLENPMGYTDINHKDEDKTNNHIDNLEFCDRVYNCNYGTRNQRMAEKMRGRKLSEEHKKKVAEKNTNNPKLSKAVIAIHKINGLILEFPSIREAGRSTGIPHQSIYKCCKGKYKSAGGFVWHYADDNE